MTQPTDRTPATAAKQALDDLFSGLRASGAMLRELTLAIYAIPHNRPRCRIRARQRQHRYYSKVMSAAVSVLDSVNTATTRR